MWVDEWIVGEIPRRPLMKNIYVDLMLPVAALLDIQNRSWNIDKLQELFYEADVDSILAMNPVFELEDYWVWVHNKSGAYSVKSGYWLRNRVSKVEEIIQAEVRPSLNDLKSETWKIKTPPKIKMLIWRAISNAIPAGELLVRRGIRMDPVCQTCGFEGESINHILFTCSIARQVWALASVPSPEGGFDLVSHFSNFHFLLRTMTEDKLPVRISQVIPWTIWFL